MEKTTYERIIGLLEDNGRLPTSRIAGTLGLNYNQANKILEEMLKEKTIKKEAETNATYWKIKR